MKYNITLSVEGYYDISVDANSMEDAKKQAYDKVINCGDLYDYDSNVLSITNEQGEEEYRQDDILEL